MEHNNRLEIATDALTVGFYVDRSYADQFHEHQYKLGIDDSNSFADWGQRIIRQWNKMLANSRYPEAPNGALDRVRLDLVRVVPDQAIPFQGGDWPTNFRQPGREIGRSPVGISRTSSTSGTSPSTSRPSRRASPSRTWESTGSSWTLR